MTNYYCEDSNQLASDEASADQDLHGFHIENEQYQ